MNNAFEELLAFQRALKDLAASVDATYAKQHEEFYIGLEGSFGSKHVTPRTLTSRLLGSMVCVEGIITKCERIGSFLPSVASFAAPLLTVCHFLLQVPWCVPKSCAASTTAPPRRRRWKGSTLT